MFTNQASPTFCGWSLYSLLFGSQCVLVCHSGSGSLQKGIFQLLFVFWCKMSVIVSHTRDCLGISCKWTKTKYEMQSKENDVYMNCIQTVRGQINICGSQNSNCDLHTPVSMIIRFPSSKKEAASVGQEENMESSPAQSQEQTGLSSDYDARRDGEPTWRW